MLIKQIFEKFYEQLAQTLNTVGYGVVLFDKWDVEFLDIGFVVDRSLTNMDMTIGEYVVEQIVLPAVNMMTTSVFYGPRTDLHIAYGQMVTWFEAHNYQYLSSAPNLYLSG